MVLAELIRRVRTEAKDTAEPYFWSDEDITAWINDAVDEACIRGRLILAADDQDVCVVGVTAGRSVYPLHAALYELTYLCLHPADSSMPTKPLLVSGEVLDAAMPEWRQRSGKPTHAVQSDTGIRLVPTPDADAELRLEGYRLPIEPMRIEDAETAEPEIHQAHHRHLVQWALHKGFSVPDMETFDPERSSIAAMEFTRYFGIRPDVKLRRQVRVDEPHHVRTFWP